MQRDEKILNWVQNTIHALGYVEVLAGNELNKYIDSHDVHYNLLQFQDELERRIAEKEAFHENSNE